MRITGSIAAATFAIALLAGCGSPAPSAPSGPGSSAPATQPTASPTEVAPAPAETSAAPGGGSELSADDFLKRVSGAAMKTYTMDMEMSTSIEGAPMTITTSGSFDSSDAASPRSHMKMNISGMEVEMIVVDGDAFMKMAMLGDQWMKMDPKDAAEMAGTSGPDIGRWTEDYRLTLKPEALGDLGMKDAGFEATGVVFDVWIDGDGFTRKFAMDMSGDLPTAMTATLDDINEPVTIEAPKDWVEMPS
jgi:hypothetical protein